MAAYRCYNPDCADEDGMPGFAFDSDAPVCPKCKLDRRTDGKDAIVPLVAIHLLIPDKAGPIRGAFGKRWSALCDNRLKLDRDAKFRATPDPSAVTCKACIQHADFPEDVDLKSMIPDWQVGKELKELK